VIERQHHDLGGRPAGKVERTEHEHADWERRVDALETLLASKRLVPRDQRRKHIEALPPALYDGLSYYQRWLVGLTQSLVERGVISTAELAKKMREVGSRGYHDMGGQIADRVAANEHDYALWERRVDALLTILAGMSGAKPLMTVDELRKNIEALPPDAYDKMNYYDRWVSSITQTLIQRGVITTEELARKMAEVNGRTKV
jgi:hypothetical protein